MSSARKAPGEAAALTRTFGLRLALWYATLFVSGAIAIVFVTYCLTAVVAGAARPPDHQRQARRLRGRLPARRRARARRHRPRGAAGRARAAVRPRRRSRRRVGGPQQQRRAGIPSKLEIVSATLADGTLVQVGKSTEARDDLLARFRATLGIVTLLIVVDRADRRLAGDAVGAVSDPPADAGGAANHPHRPDRRACAARRQPAMRSTS